MKKLYFYTTIVLLLLSCKEKQKPFTYDYVEIARANHCWGGDISCKIDSNHIFYVPENAIFNNWKQPVTIGKLPDSLLTIVDSIAYKVYNYKDSIVKQDCYGCYEFAVVVVKNNIKKTYYSNSELSIDGDIYFFLEKICEIKDSKQYQTKNMKINNEARIIVAPPLPPLPPINQK